MCMAIDLKCSHWYQKYIDNVDLVLGMKNVFELEGDNRHIGVIL